MLMPVGTMDGRVIKGKIPVEGHSLYVVRACEQKNGVG